MYESGQVAFRCIRDECDSVEEELKEFMIVAERKG